MRATRQLREAGQNLWVDIITRTLLKQCTLAAYIDQDSVTGLPSNLTIFDKAIEAGTDYDAEIATCERAGGSDGPTSRCSSSTP